MTAEELHILSLYEVREILFQHIEKNPAEFALSLRNSPYPVALLATQLKYLQRAKEKLPTFYDVAAIIPPISYEQCSSEKAAEAKDFQGNSCLDLTCGLGIDSLHFAKHFAKVISVEKDAVLTAIAKHNFALLKMANISLINDSAEDFLKNYLGEKFDMIYLDPSRRNDKGAKVFLPQDCSPNLQEILPLLLQKGSKIVVKFSPLYDISAAQKDFPLLSEIQILSIDNECKEVILIFEEKKEPIKITLICGRKEEFLRFYFSQQDSAIIPKEVARFDEIQKGIYIYEPDVAFYKARMVSALFANDYANYVGFLSHTQGFFFSTEKIPNFAGRMFQVLEMWEYQPKKIKAFCEKNNILKVNILQRNFPFSTENIRTSIKIKEGGTRFLLCTNLEAKNYTFYCERILD